MEKKRGFLKGVLCGTLATLIIVAAGGAAYTHFTKEEVLDKNAKGKLEVIDQLIEWSYLHGDEIDKNVLVEQMLKGYVDGLGDVYSTYYTEEETRSLFEGIEGEFGGIGVSALQDDESGSVIFVEIHEGSPAESAGFQEGDVVYKIDGEDVTEYDIDKVLSKIKGDVGTEVEITILRGENREEVTATLVRERIETQTVLYEMAEEQIGYIGIKEFDTVTLKQFENALSDLETREMKGLVIDLRDNPGGSLDTVCDMLDLLLPEGTIVYTENRSGKGDTYTSDEEHKLEIPLAVLVNGRSASASEIFAGAVQDYGTGTIVGTTTFGKGVVQNVFPLSDGTSLKLTVSEYFTPKGRSINGIGIVPDVEVEFDTDGQGKYGDNQLEKAIEIVKERMEAS